MLLLLRLMIFLFFLFVSWFRLLTGYFVGSFTHWFIYSWFFLFFVTSFLLLFLLFFTFFYFFTSSSFLRILSLILYLLLRLLLSSLPLLFHCFYCLPLTIYPPIYLLHPIHHSLYSFSFLPPFLHLFSGWREGGERKITLPLTRTHIRGSV